MRSIAEGWEREVEGLQDTGSIRVCAYLKCVFGAFTREARTFVLSTADEGAEGWGAKVTMSHSFSNPSIHSFNKYAKCQSTKHSKVLYGLGRETRWHRITTQTGRIANCVRETVHREPHDIRLEE